MWAHAKLRDITLATWNIGSLTGKMIELVDVMCMEISIPYLQNTKWWFEACCGLRLRAIDKTKEYIEANFRHVISIYKSETSIMNVGSCICTVLFMRLTTLSTKNKNKSLFNYYLNFKVFCVHIGLSTLLILYY